MPPGSGFPSAPPDRIPQVVCYLFVDDTITCRGRHRPRVPLQDHRGRPDRHRRGSRPPLGLRLDRAALPNPALL